MLYIKKDISGNKVTFTLDGRLDTTTAPEMEKEINSCIRDVDEMVLDMKNLEYISSVGLRVLLNAYKELAGRGSLKVLNVCETVQEVFEVTGFADILDIG